MSFMPQKKRTRVFTDDAQSSSPGLTNPSDLVDKGDAQALVDEFLYDLELLYSSNVPASQLQACKRCIELVLPSQPTRIFSRVSTWSTYSKLAEALKKASSDVTKSVLTLGLLLLSSNTDEPCLENFSTHFLQAVFEVRVTCKHNTIASSHHQSTQNLAFHTKRKFKAAEPSLSRHADAAEAPSHQSNLLKDLRTLFGHPAKHSNSHDSAAGRDGNGSDDNDVALLQSVYVNRYFTLLLDCMDKCKARDDATTTHATLLRCLQEAQSRGCAACKSLDHLHLPSYVHTVCMDVQACMQGGGRRFLWLLLGILEGACHMSPSSQKHILTFKMREGCTMVSSMCGFLDSLHCRAFKEVMDMGMGSAESQYVYGIHREECDVVWGLFKDLHSHAQAYTLEKNAHNHTQAHKHTKTLPQVHTHVVVGDGDVYASLLKCMIGVCNVYGMGKGYGGVGGMGDLGVEGLSTMSYLQDFVYVLNKAQGRRRAGRADSLGEGQDEYEKFLLEISTSALSLLCNLLEMFGHIQIPHAHSLTQSRALTLCQHVVEYEVGVNLRTKYPELHRLEAILSCSDAPASQQSLVPRPALPPYLSFLCASLLEGTGVFMQDLLDTQQDFVSSGVQAEAASSVAQITNSSADNASHTHAHSDGHAKIPLSDIVYAAYLTMHLVTCLQQPSQTNNAHTHTHARTPSDIHTLTDGHTATPPSTHTHTHTPPNVHTSTKTPPKTHKRLAELAELLGRVCEALPGRSLWLLTRTVNAYMSIQCQTGLMSMDSLAPWLKLARLLSQLDSLPQSPGPGTPSLHNVGSASHTHTHAHTSVSSSDARQSVAGPTASSKPSSASPGPSPLRTYRSPYISSPVVASTASSASSAHHLDWYEEAGAIADTARSGTATAADIKRSQSMPTTASRSSSKSVIADGITPSSSKSQRKNKSPASLPVSPVKTFGYRGGLVAKDINMDVDMSLRDDSAEVVMHGSGSNKSADGLGDDMSSSVAGWRMKRKFATM